uniref:Endonuclease/exonuclease/phosphatase domain-containing protein n=1 Tax=Branchiostoma floridae TaxID=7739 RepID=C3ZYD8_BRAFL|eukprot:XP_002586429.1 hypothetical protein BRAFLDRAFT_131819 [Branchiostoma floridae]
MVTDGVWTAHNIGTPTHLANGALCGVEQNQRATHGVGFILHPDTAKKLSDTVYISERIIKITIRDKDSTTNYFQVYAPCNDSYTEEEKDRFFEQLSDNISLVADEEEMVVMGDFNGRVGRRRDPWTAYLGPHSDRSTECNYNGHQLLSLCAEYDLVISNTLFQHRPSHTQTWYRWSDITVSSQIDFILTRASRRTTVQDARAIPNAGLDTDHRPVLMYMRGKGNESHKRKLPHEPQINIHKLRKNMDIQEEIKQRVTERLEQEDTWDKSAEETWSIFRDTLLDCLKSTCGKKKNGRGQRKATKWWNDEVKEAVREKKRLYKNVSFCIGNHPLDNINTTPFKFLGGYVSASGSSGPVADILRESIIGSDEKNGIIMNIDASPIRGEYKCEIYRTYVQGAIRFLLSVHDVTLSHLQKLNSSVTQYLKKWAGMKRSTNPGLLYHSQGLGLTSVEQIYLQEHATVIASAVTVGDSTVRNALEAKLEREGTLSRKSTGNLDCNTLVTETLTAMSSPNPQGIQETPRKTKETLCRKTKAHLRQSEDRKIEEHCRTLTVQDKNLFLLFYNHPLGTHTKNTFWWDLEADAMATAGGV